MNHVRIGQLLIRAGLISQAELDEALTAQQIYGGRLGTVLVEHEFVDEDQLAEVLARQHGMQRVTREHLTNIPPEVIAAVPAAVAQRFQVVPFNLDEERKAIWLAIPDRADLRLQDELHFAIGRKVEFALAPEILLRRALDKYYDVVHHRRFIKVHMDGHAKKVRRPVAPPTGSALDAPAMLRLIVEAPDQGELLDRSLDCLATFAEDVVLLTLDEEGLVGWGGRGELAGSGSLTEARVLFADSPPASEALAAQTPVLLEHGSEAELRKLLIDRLGLSDEGPLAVLPLVVADSPMGCFVLGRLRSKPSFDPALVAEIVRRVAWRFQAIHLMNCVAAPLGAAR